MHRAVRRERCRPGGSHSRTIRRPDHDTHADSESAAAMRQPPAATGRESSETACPSALVPCALRTYGAPCRETSRSLSGPLCPVTVDLPFCHWDLAPLAVGAAQIAPPPVAAERLSSQAGVTSCGQRSAAGAGTNTG